MAREVTGALSDEELRAFNGVTKRSIDWTDAVVVEPASQVYT